MSVRLSNLDGEMVHDLHEADVDGAVGREPEEPDTQVGRADEDVGVLEFLDRCVHVGG